MENIRLGQWKVMGSLPYQADFSPFVTEGRLFNPPTNLVPWIDATVPGSIYRDLERAGFIEDPYFDRNSLHCEWVGGRWWTYRTTFTVTDEQLQKTLKLRFGGIDYSAKIYINGKKVKTASFKAKINPANKELVTIGKGWGGWWIMEGLVATTQIYDKVLSPEQVAEIAKQISKVAGK